MKKYPKRQSAAVALLLFLLFFIPFLYVGVSTVTSGVGPSGVFAAPDRFGGGIMSVLCGLVFTGVGSYFAFINMLATFRDRQER